MLVWLASLCLPAELLVRYYHIGSAVATRPYMVATQPVAEFGSPAAYRVSEKRKHIVCAAAFGAVG